MKENKKNIFWFKELGIKDVPDVGGKNASLGEMYNNLLAKGVNLANGFATTSGAYFYFLEQTGIKQQIKETLQGFDYHDLPKLQIKGKQVRELILAATLPQDLQDNIISAYRELSKSYNTQNVDVAVRSSATAEDLPGASFAGQQETFLNITGDQNLLLSVRKCFASLFTDRAISYRADKNFGQTDIGLSVAVQKMVRSDLAASGIAFTLDTETGFDKVVSINGVYGL